MKVTATKMGYHGDTRRKPGGEPFDIHDKDFDPSWMKKVETAQKAATGGEGGADPAGGTGGDGSPLEKLKVDELKAMAKQLDIDGADGMKKADLIAAIEAAQKAATGE